MSILNHGLQAVALARKVMPEEMKAEATKCNSLKALRAVAERNVGFKEAAMDSIAPVKILLIDIVRRLELKEQKLNVFTAATGEEMDRLWTALLALDQEFQYGRSDNRNCGCGQPAR